MGEDLKYLTQDALMFSDTFDYDTNESLRSADKLMKQFGLTGTDAMALIAEGSQKGLNFADDLLPTIDEYSVYFKQAGMDASDMFGLFENAKKAGVFNLDYAADAVKEFGIIMTEEGDGATEVLDGMGLNGAKLRDEFAKGGESAKTAMRTVADSLMGIKDPQDQIAAGVSLFGTKFEDMGATAVVELLKVNDSIQGSTEVLDSINSIKYNTFGEALAGIGRQITTDIVLPISEKLMPKMNEFSQWITDHMPQIKEGFKTTFDGATSVVKGTIDVIKDISFWIKDHWGILEPILAGIAAGAIAYITITKSIAAYKAIMALATAAQLAMNGAMAMNPIGIVVAAIGLLVAAGITLYKNWDTVKVKMSNIWISVQEGAAKMVNGVISGINWMIEKINKIPGVDIPLIGKVSWGSDKK